MNMVELDSVSKWFGEVVAVSDLSFSVGPGVTALLGPNGAGKSTVMRLLCGLATPSQGAVRVLGGDPRHDLSLMARIGLAPQQESMFDMLTPLEFVTAAATLLRVSGPEVAARAALDTVALDAKDPKRIKALSKGNRQRVKLAAALVHDPEVLVLDEPLTGLDPRQRLQLIGLIHHLGDPNAARPRCVIVSSHVLDEVERLGSRVLVIAQGRLAAEGDFRAIRGLMDERPHRIRVATDDPRGLAAALVEAGAVVGLQVDDEGVTVDTTDAPSFRHQVALVARDRGARLHEVAPLDDDLESVFRYLVGR